MIIRGGGDQHVVTGLVPALFAALMIASVSLRAFAADAGPAGPHVLVVHDPPTQAAPGLRAAVPALIALLGHFDCRIQVIETDAYQGGEAEDHDAVIYVGLKEGTKLPRALLRDLSRTEKPVCWLGANLGQLDARALVRVRGFEIVPSEPQVEYTRVLYRGQLLSRPDIPLARLRLARPEKCEVLAQAEGGGPEIPYAIHSGNLWYFSDPPLQTFAPDGCYLVLCDQLHAFLGVSHPEERKVLLRIADVNPLTDPDAVRNLSGLLRTEEVPFAIAITPVYRDPARGVEEPLSAKRRLVGILREAQTAGAAVIAEGYTHQSFGRTGEDAEWWDVKRDLPLASRSAVETRRRVKKSVAELLKCGLVPVAWTTPKGRAGAGDYAVFAEHFSTACERRQPTETAREPQVFPFLIRSDNYGQRILPDNLPSLGKEGKVERVLEQVHPQSLVPDPWVTVNISPEAPPEAVRMLLAELRGMEYRPVDIRRMTNWVKVENLGIYTQVAPRPLADLLPKGWDAFMLVPGQRGAQSFEKPGRDGRETAVLKPGAVLVTFPAGMRPKQVFAFEGGPEAASHRLVLWVARAALIIGLILVGVFGLAYVAQLLTRRA